MSQIFKIEGSGKSLNISEVKKTPGENKAYGFLRKVNKKLNNDDKKLNLEQAKKIRDSVITVRDACKNKSPTMYKLQAALNPFSKAWKIERFSKNILIVTNKAIESHKDNIDNPYEYFTVSDATIKSIRLVRDLEGLILENVGFLFLSDSDPVVTHYKPYTKIYYLAPVKIDKDIRCIRLMRKEEIDEFPFERGIKNTLNYYDVIDNYASTIIKEMRQKNICQK